MAKKLLMSNNKNEGGMMFPPVTDGLCCFLDSNTLSTDSTEWIDYVGNNVFTMTGFNSGGVKQGVVTMNKNAKIDIASLNFNTVFIGFYRNNTSAQIDLIGTNPKTARFCMRANDYNIYSVNLSKFTFYNVCETSVFPDTASPAMITSQIGKYDTGIIHMFMQFSQSSHSNLRVGYDTNSGSTHQIFYAAFYNRELSAEERNAILAWFNDNYIL